jgi:ferredoxin
MKIAIDDNLCQGHLRCLALNPELFGADELGHGVVLSSEVPEEFRDAAIEAEQACPERAIRVSPER